MVVALMKNLVVALIKLAVKNNTADPVTTVLGCFIDFVTAQDKATQATLGRMVEHLDDLKMNPFRVGKRTLMAAQKIPERKLREERILHALDAFTEASEFDPARLSDPLMPLYARFSVGACYDLLNQGPLALDYYEEAFRDAKKMEKIAERGAYTKDTFDVILDVVSSPLDALGDWLESRDADYKKQQQFILAVVEKKQELYDFTENLLTLIVARKGVARDEYLKPWAPRERKLVDRFKLPNLREGVGVGNLLNQPGRSQPALSTQGLVFCPKCNSLKTYEICPVCHGQKMVGLVKCNRCNGVGKTRVCGCDKTTNLFNRPLGQFRSPCIACGGKGKVSFTGGHTWVPCRICGGTGFSKF